MRSNRFSAFFGITSFGESHGPAMGVVIEDIRPNIDFPFAELDRLVSLRKPRKNNYSTSRCEEDEYKIVSGVFEGKTTGMPICILFPNTDSKPEDYDYLKDIFRPGHADYSFYKKFKIYDYRGGGRASGRETISRIAASALVSDLLGPAKICFNTIQIGEMLSDNDDSFVQASEKNPFCWTDHTKLKELDVYLDNIKADKETLGGIIQIKIDNVPAGLGDPAFEKINANLAKALFSIGTVRGVSFGTGFDNANLKGSESNDQMDESGFLSNKCGGINGGITNGQPIIINIIIKPVSSHGKTQKTLTKHGKYSEITVQGRHDVCHIPRIIPVIEAMIKLTLADAIAWQKQISGENLSLNDYRETLDKLDEDLILTLYRRKQVVGHIRSLKKRENMPFRDCIREKEIENLWQDYARELNLSIDEIKHLLDIVLRVCRNDNPDHSV
jgi:chorismate synthase